MYISPKEYHTWAQQSLNRVQDIVTKIKVNGESHEQYDEYKSVVKKYQKKYLGRVTGVVDEATQNALIHSNHVDFLYSKWIREAIYKITGDNGVIGKSGHDPYLVASIKRYQDAKNKTAKNGKLSVDGWVGVKTELVLALDSGLTVPDKGVRPPQIKPIEQHITEWLDELIEDMDLFSVPVPLPLKLYGRVDDRLIFGRFVNRLSLGNMNYDYLDWYTVKNYMTNADKVGKKPGQYVDVPAVESLDKINALRYLRKLVYEGVNPNHPQAYKHFIWKCWEVFEDVEKGLVRIVHELHRSSVDTTKGRAKAIIEWTDAKVLDTNSILSCWPAWKSCSGGPWWND